MSNQQEALSLSDRDLITQIQQLKDENIALKKRLNIEAEENETIYGSFEQETLLQQQTNEIALVGGWEIDLSANRLFWTSVTRQIHEVEEDYTPSIETAIQFYREGISRQTILATVDEALVNAVPFDVELEIVTAKGNLRWIRAKGKPVFIEGKPVKISGIFQDITTEKKLADEYRDMQEKFKSAFYHSALGMAIANLDGSWQEINDQFCEIVGYSKEELLKRGIRSLTHPDDLGRSISLLKELQNGLKKTGKLEKRYLHKNTQVVWVSLAVSVIINQQGKVTQFIFQLEDISYRKQMQEALHKSEQEYRSLFEQNPFGVFSLGRDGYFTSANMVMVLKLGFTKDQFLKLHYSKFVQPSYLQRSDEKITAAFSGQPQKDEILFIAANGEKMVFSLILLPIVVNNKITGIYGIANDITANKNTERALMESEDNLRTIFESTGVGKIMLDRSFNVVSFNSPAASFTILAHQKELQAQAALVDYFPKDRHREMLQILNDVLAGNKIEYDKEIVHGNGERHWFHVRFTPVINSRQQTGRIVMSIENITDQKNAAEAIRHERNQLRTLIDNIPDSIYIKDAAARKVLANKIDLELMGVDSEAAVIGKTDREIYEHVELHKGYDDDLYVMDTGLPIINREECFSNLDGSLRWLLTTKVALKNEQDVVTGLLGIGRDITQQKNQQVAIRKSNERFEMVTRATFDAVWDWDIVTNQLYRGEGFETIFGYSPVASSASFENWNDLIHPDDRERVLEKFSKTIAGNDTKWQDEFRFLKADGSYAFVIDKSIIVKDESGKSIRMIGAMQDISVRKEEELQLRLFESVIKNIHDAVLITTAEPIDENGPAIVFINDAFTEISGYTFQNIAGKTPRIFQGAKTDRTQLDKIKNALQNWQPVEVELLNYKKNGEEFWVNISIVPLANEKGLYTHWISIQKDITIKKRAAEELKVFYDLLAIINTTDSFDNILKNAIRQIADHLQFDFAEAWTANFVKSKIVFRAMYQNGDVDTLVSNKLYSEFDKGEGLPGTAVEQKKIIYLEDLQCSPFLRQEDFKNAGIRSGIAIPIFFDGEVVAVFCFYSKKAFTPEQQQSGILQKISSQLGAGIQKNRIEAELNSFFSLSPDMLCIAGFDGFFKKVNPAFTEIIGYTEAEFLSIPQIEFVHPADWEKTNAETKRLLSGGKPGYFENRYITRNAVVKWLAWSFTAVLDEGLVFAVAKDITYSKKLEEEKNNILESISDYFYALDANFNFTYINSAAEKLLNKPGNSLIGKSIWEVLPALKNTAFHTNAIEALSGQLPVHFEFFYEPASTWFEESFYPTDDGLSIFFRSVNSRKESEARLNEMNTALAKNTADLEASNAELERFAYVASHDLQEPLRMVSGFMQLLQKKYDPVLDENGKKYIDFAIDGAARMKTLIHDLLHYSKAGAQELEKEPVDMNNIMEDIQMLLKTTMNTTGTTLVFDPLPMVNAHPVMITQLMQNLISNAIKYQPKGNRPVVKIGCLQQENAWVFSIEDNGIGIPAGYEEKVFEVFQRLHTRQHYNGTGIGLSICKKIAEKLGGKIWVESVEGAGSVFKFTVPV